MTNGVSFEELEYVSGTTSNIQEQINNKQNTLVQGSNITINNDTISAANGSDTVLAPGFMAPFPDNDAPTGWLLCDGSEISRSDYSALFASIGTIYGAGDGNSTFNLPNFNSSLKIYILALKDYHSSATLLSKISKNRLISGVSYWS